MPESRKRRWPIRLVQLSPLVAITVLAVVWFTVPSQLAPQLANSGMVPEGATFTPAMRSGWVDLMAESQTSIELGITGNGPSFQSVAEESWTNWVDELGSHPTTASVFASPPKSADATAFAALAEWERGNGARVWVWVTPAPPNPSLIASSVPNDALRATVAGRAEQDMEATPGDGSHVPSSFDEWLFSTGRPSEGPYTPLQLETLQVGTGSGFGSGGWQLDRYILESGGLLYPAFVATAVDPYAQQSAPSLVDLPKLDPAAADFSAKLASLAAEKSVDIWVFGPLDLNALPLRLPEGASEAPARALGAAIWPELAIARPDQMPTTFTTLDKQVATLAGGSTAAMQVTGLNNTASLSSAAPGGYGYTAVAPQTVAYLAVWNRPPHTPSAWETMWLRWRRFVAGWFPYLLGGTVALLALTLVASPAAFVYERRLTARERVAEEMARMRRDVHDKVYNRLSALSKRVAASSGTTGQQDSTELGAIAEDIRSTVGELQGILGDEVRHTSSALTSVPLATQIASVCAAQAARLGIDVACSADDDLPDADARLGWDLQCISEEAIANAVRHGGAGHVTVALTRTGATLELTVSDDGSGTAVRQAADAPEGSTGLRGAAERLGRRGGSLALRTGDPVGTVLVARVPFEPPH